MESSWLLGPAPRVLSEDELGSFVDNFRTALAKPNKKAIQLDTDRDGTLDRNQLTMLIKQHLSREPTVTEVTSLDAAVDATSDHRLSIAEYIRAVAGSGWSVAEPPVQDDTPPPPVFLCQHSCTSRVRLERVPPLYVEMGVTEVSCDGCGKEVIQDEFYHCILCKSYDTCADCYEQGLNELVCRRVVQ